MEEVDFKRMIKYFWSKKIFIVCVMIIGAILGFAYTKFGVKPEYRAATSLILTEREFKDEADVTSYSKLVDRYSIVASSRSVAQKVKENLKIDKNLEEFRDAIIVTGMPTSYCIKIEVMYDSSQEAVKIADEVAKVLIEEIANIYNDDKIKVLDYAIEEKNPVNVDFVKNIAIFSIVGTAIVFGIFLCKFMYIESSDVNLANENKDV